MQKEIRIYIFTGHMGGFAYISATSESEAWNSIEQIIGIGDDDVHIEYVGSEEMPDLPEDSILNKLISKPALIAPVVIKCDILTF